MSDATEDDQAAKHRRRARSVIAGAVLIGAGAVGVGTIITRQEPAPPGSTIVAPSTTTTVTTSAVTQTPVPPTTVSAFTAEFSPFEREELVSRTSAIPENPPHDDAAASIYVDPQSGNDRAPGTVTEPVATLEAARRIARQELQADRGDVVVYLRDGVHLRDEAFTLDFRDSGRGNDVMIYRSFPGEQAIVEGGLPVQSWEPAFGSVVVAEVPAGVADMRQFFAAGERQQRARTSGATGVASEFVVGPLLDRQRNVAMIVDTDLIEDLSNPEDLELVYIGTAISGHGQLEPDGTEDVRPSWKAHRLPVDSATYLGNGTTRLDISNGALYHASERGYAPLEILPSDPFFIENALELLDESGEWYFDPRRRLLYWWPPTQAALADAWIPVTQTLLDLDGTPKRPVRNIRIEGLAFRHAAYTVPNDAGYVVSQASYWFTGWEPPDWMEDDGARHPYLDRPRPAGIPGAAVEVDSARRITFSANTFTELGAIGVLLQNDVGRAVFDGNLFVDISAAALVAGHPEHDEIDEPMEGPIASLAFTNNIVDRAGAEFYASVGVQVTKASGAEVSHNLFRNLPYTAISAGWGWDNNPNSTVHRAIRIENNYFENVVNVLYDGAPIYLLGPVAEPGAGRDDYVEVRGNFANNAGAGPQFKAPSEAADPSYAKRPGVQIDEGSRNVVISDNVFTGATVWLQVTEWPTNRNVPGWADGLAYLGARNWTDNGASVPTDTRKVGIDRAKVFDFSDVPDAVLQIIELAGLEPGVSMPPLP